MAQLAKRDRLFTFPLLALRRNRINKVWVCSDKQIITNESNEHQNCWIGSHEIEPTQVEITLSDMAKEFPCV